MFCQHGLCNVWVWSPDFGVEAFVKIFQSAKLCRHVKCIACKLCSKLAVAAAVTTASSIAILARSSAIIILLLCRRYHNLDQLCGTLTYLPT